MSEEEPQNTTQTPDCETEEQQNNDAPANDKNETENNGQKEYTGSDLWVTEQDAALTDVLKQHTIQLDEQNNTVQEEVVEATEVATAIVVVEEEKPAVGTEAWHKLRRENHKQVERRRRETINEGINEIAKMVPGSEKNKGSILQRAAVYIRQLKEAETATVEKWTLEKLLTDQAISELNRQVELLKSESEHLRIENEYLKRRLDEKDQSESKKQKLDHEE